MFQHLILGLLRAGGPGYAFALAKEIERRAGNAGYPANAGRALGKLKDEGLVTREPNAPGEDEGRIPYAITPKGCQMFDAWLVSWEAIEEDFSTWLLFIDRVPADVRDRFLERREDELWFMIKSINRALEDALAQIRRNGNERFSAVSAQLRRRIMQLSADLEFIRELRKELGSLPPHGASPGGREGNR